MLTKIVRRGGVQNAKCIPSVLKMLSTSHNMYSTVDPDEMARFKKLSSIWWNEMGGMKPLHSMNKLRVPLVRDGLIHTGLVKKELINSPKPLKDMNILEVGCGGGILTEALARLGGNMTGIDASPELIEQANHHAKLDPSLSNNLTYSLVTVEDHATANHEKYDAVIASEVLEHVNEKQVFVTACVKCLKPGGSIFITTLNKTMASWIGGIVFAENILNIVPRGTHEWDKFIAPHQTQKMLEDNNCRTRVLHGMCYNFLTNKWMWISNTSVNYALHAVKS